MPQGWQGALPFRYHLGPGGVRVHLVSQQDYQRRIIWDVIGKIKGSEYPDEWVVIGNHRDAWVYGAVDPNSGTAAMLEAVHGIGALLKEAGAQAHHHLLQLGRRGGRPDRFHRMGGAACPRSRPCGRLLQHRRGRLRSGFLRRPPFPRSSNSCAMSPSPCPAPWAAPSTRSGALNRDKDNEHRASNAPPQPGEEVHVSDLGSGSDFTPFLQHAGVPSTDIGSGGPYGVYHSAFDNYAWFVMNADPHFVYLQEMARVFGLEALRMADADVLPYDYVAYAREIGSYLDAAKRKAADDGLGSLDFGPAQAASCPLYRRSGQSHTLVQAVRLAAISLS